MNILLISQYAGSPKMGENYRPYFLARSWAAAGDIVTILAADYAGVRFKNPRIKQDLESEEINGICYRFVKVTIPKGSAGKKEGNIFRFEKSLFFNAAQLAKQHSPDIVIMGSIHPFDIYPARRICRYSKAELVYDLQDLYALRCVSEYGFHPDSSYVRFVNRTQKAALHDSSRIVYTTPGLLSYLKSNGVSHSKTLWIPNGIPFSEEQADAMPQRQMDFVRRYREKQMFAVLYYGSFTSQEALETFVKSAGSVGRDVVYFLAGSGTYKILLKRLARQQGVNNLFFLDGCAPLQEQQLLQCADCFYYGASDPALQSYELGCDQLYRYMYAQKPVIYATSFKQNLVERARCGVTVNPNDSMEIAGAVETLKNMTAEEREAMGKNGREYCVREHLYPSLAARYRAELLHLVGKENSVQENA